MLLIAFDGSVVYSSRSSESGRGRLIMTPGLGGPLIYLSRLGITECTLGVISGHALGRTI